MDFEQITQECFLPNPALLNKMAARAINRKKLKRLLLLNKWTDFKTFSQECSLGDFLLKLLKSYSSVDSVEQDGAKSYK